MGIWHRFVSAKSDGADPTLVRASNWDDDHVVDVLAPTGITGSVAASRYVGGTASAAPSTGTFAVGDFVIAQTGKIFICTVAGSPGTWVQSGTTISDYVSGSTGTGHIIVPGLAGSGDHLPASPSAADHEFDVALADGFAIGSPDIINTTDIPSHLHIQKTACGTFSLHGRGWTLAALGISIPFTMSAKISDMMTNASYRMAGVGIAEASPGKFLCRQHGSAAGYGLSTFNVGRSHYSSPTARSAWDGDDVRSIALPTYWRYIVHSSTNVDIQYSPNGLVWTPLDTAYNPSFTVGSVALFIGSADNNQTAEAAFDWIRFS
jgi:hypothetical protein